MERTWNEHGLCRFFVGGNREREVTFAYTARDLCLGQELLAFLLLLAF